MLMDACIGRKLYSMRCYGHCPDIFHLLERITKSANSVLFAFLDSSENHASHKSNLSGAKRICQFPAVEKWVVDLHGSKQRGDMHRLNPLGFVGCNA
jgi:hypothetical protein